MAKDRSSGVREVILESARVQVATLNAGIAFWTAWTDMAASYAQTVSRELANVSEDDADTDAVIGRLTDSSRELLRRMTDLPNVAVARFNDEVNKKPKGNGRARPARSARVKD